MILPNTDISIMDVRNIIGCPSTDLGTLCAKAKTGGSGGYAFQIVENGYTLNDGNMIENSEPYYNIWSNNAAGEWYVKLPDRELIYRLKRETPTAKNYAYKLGNFRGYNSNAPKPYLFKDGSQIYLQQSQYAVPVGVTIFWELGEIDWETVFNSKFTDIKVYGDKTLYTSRPMLEAMVNIEEYNILGHYTIETYSTAFAGCVNGDKFYFWGEFYNNGALIANFPATSYGIIQWAEYWKDNKLGNVTAVYAANNYNTASNYSILSPTLSDTTDFLTFQLYRTGDNQYNIDKSRCYIRCKWRDKDSWQDCPSYSIELPPENYLTRTCTCKLPLRADKEEYIDIQLVLN